MSRGSDATYDLRLGLRALESGAVDEDQLLALFRTWARSSKRTLSEILVDRGGLDTATIARLESQVARDLENPAEEPGPREPDPSSTVSYAQATPADVPGPFPGPIEDGKPRYRDLRPHGRGGLGEVFVAFDGELNRSVALKELQGRFAHDPTSQGRFLAEAAITGRLEHPGIVPVYSLGRYPDGRPFYAMRFIEGETLRDAIERYHRRGPSSKGDDRELAFRRLLRSVIDACNAVAYAHSRGVVHRDLKPENIMLGRFGETLVVDWGLAKSISESEATKDGPTLFGEPPGDPSMTRPGALIGTPRYMSPEQASGASGGIGAPSDVYSLGAILYCVLVGHPPILDEDLPSLLNRVRRGIFPSPRRLRKTIDPTMEAICLKAMALDPANRHASALELAEDLEAWLADVRYRSEQEVALNQVKGSLTRLCLERAHNWFAQDSAPEGMLWMARALENAPAEPPDLQRVIRTSLAAWHLRSRLLERSFRHDGRVHALAFCPEGRRLATASEDRTARLWDVSTGTPFSPPLKHPGSVRAVAFGPDGNSVATAGDDGAIHLWHGMTGERAVAPIPCGGPVASLRFSPDGRTLAAAGVEGLVLFDVAADRPILDDVGHRSRVLAVAFSPDGSTVAVGLEDGEVQLVEIPGGRRTEGGLGHRSGVSVLSFHPDGRKLLTGSSDGHARLWDLSRRTSELTLPHQGGVHCAEFRPDGDAFATACEDGTARLWNSTSGHPIGEPLSHRARVDCLAFRPDGLQIATGSPDGTVRLWCASTALPIGPPLLHGGAVRALAFSQDGRRLASGGADSTVQCWKVPNPIEGHVERISCWVGVATELEFDEGDAIRRMEGSTSWDLRRRLNDLGGAPFR